MNMDCRRFCLIFLTALVAQVECSGDYIKNEKNSTERVARKEILTYSPPDAYASKKDSTAAFYSSEDTYSAEEPDGFQPAEFRISPKTKYSQPISYEPYPFHKSPHASPKSLYKSGTNVNWNVWKGEMMPDATGMGDKKPTSPPPPPPPEMEEWYFPAGAWKGDSWTPEQMMMMMSKMPGMMEKPKPSLLSKLFHDPMAILLAFTLPVSLMLAAVLPTLMNMMMNGGLPTITTTATGNKGRGGLDGAEFLSPVVEAITTFGSRALDNPSCMQRIFCQVTKGSADNHTDTRPLQKALYKISKLVDKKLLENFGVKDLFESMSDGNCEKIPCAAFKPAKKYEKS